MARAHNPHLSDAAAAAAAVSRIAALASGRPSASLVAVRATVRAERLLRKANARRRVPPLLVAA